MSKKKIIALAVVPVFALVLAGCSLKKDAANQSDQNKQSVDQLGKDQSASKDSSKAGDDKGKQGALPQESITACQNKAEGDTCTVTMAAPVKTDSAAATADSSVKTITGTCKAMSSELACVPAGGPDGAGAGKPQGGANNAQ